MPVNNMDNINLEAIFNGTRQLTEYTPSYSYVVDYKQPVWGCLFFIPSTHLLNHTISLITSQIRQYDPIGGYDKLHVAELEEAIPLMEGLIAALYTISHFNPLLSSEDVPALCDKLLVINMDRKCLAPDGYFEYEYNCYYKAQRIFKNIHRDLELTATQISFIDEAWKHIFELLRLEALEEGDNLPQTLMYLNMCYEEASHNEDDSNDVDSSFVRGSYDKICLVNCEKKESEPIEQVIVSGIAASAMNYAMHQYLKQQILSVSDFSKPLKIKHDYTSLRFDFSIRTFYEAYVEAADREKRAIYIYNPSFAIKNADEQRMYILREIMQEQEYAQNHNDANWLKSKLTSAQYNALQDIEKYFYIYLCKEVQQQTPVALTTTLTIESSHIDRKHIATAIQTVGTAKDKEGEYMICHKADWAAVLYLLSEYGEFVKEDGSTMKFKDFCDYIEVHCQGVQKPPKPSDIDTIQVNKNRLHKFPKWEKPVGIKEIKFLHYVEIARCVDDVLQHHYKK